MYTGVHLLDICSTLHIKQSQHFDPSPKTNSVLAELLNNTLILEILVRAPKTLNLISINRQICVHVFANLHWNY